MAGQATRRVEALFSTDDKNGGRTSIAFFLGLVSSFIDETCVNCERDVHDKLSRTLISTPRRRWFGISWLVSPNLYARGKKNRTTIESVITRYFSTG